MRYHLDLSHRDILKALLDAGRASLSVAHTKNLGCDIISTHVDGHPVFIECKREGPAHIRNRLSASETRLRAIFPGYFVIAQTVEEALAGVGINVATRAA